MSQMHSYVSPRDLSPETLQKLGDQATQFLEALASHPLNSPGFQDNLSQLESLGTGLDEDVRWILSNKPKAIEKIDDPEETTKEALTSLNHLVKTLSPKPTFNIINFILGRTQTIDYNKYFERYETSQEDINKVIWELLNSRDLLLKENGRIQEEEKRLYELLNKINEYSVFIDVLNDKLEEQLAEITGETKQMYSTEVGFVVKQKRQDFLTLYTVVSQAYLSLKLTRHNNEEVRRNLDNTRAMTLTALQTAQQVGYELTQQQNLLNKIDSLNNNAKETMQVLYKSELNMHRSAEQEQEAMVELGRTFKTLENVIQTFEAKTNISQSQEQNNGIKP